MLSLVSACLRKGVAKHDLLIKPLIKPTLEGEATTGRGGGVMCWAGPPPPFGDPSTHTHTHTRKQYPHPPARLHH